MEPTTKPSARGKKRTWTTLMSSKDTHAKFLRKSEQSRIPMTALLDIAGDLIAGMKASELAERLSARKGVAR